MISQPPSIILHSRLYDCYEAYNEDGRLIARRGRWDWILNVVTNLGYENVPLNSRCGRTIQDRVNNNHPF